MSALQSSMKDRTVAPPFPITAPQSLTGIQSLTCKFPSSSVTGWSSSSAASASSLIFPKTKCTAVKTECKVPEITAILSLVPKTQNQKF